MSSQAAGPVMAPPRSTRAPARGAPLAPVLRYGHPFPHRTQLPGEIDGRHEPAFRDLDTTTSLRSACSDLAPLASTSQPRRMKHSQTGVDSGPSGVIVRVRNWGDRLAGLISLRDQPVVMTLLPGGFSFGFKKTLQQHGIFSYDPLLVDPQDLDQGLRLRELAFPGGEGL